MEQATLDSVVLSKEQVLLDYRIAWESRHASLLARKEVFMGKAKFGITGDGKELAQIALAHAFRKGDWRSGYYRDQTVVAALGELTWQQYFAQIYAHTDVEAEPNTGGRMMNGHYASRHLDEQGHWLPQTPRYNIASDISPTAGQIPRSIGLGYASKLYRENPELHSITDFSIHGNEVCFATIGDASTSEGMFFEAINAAGVLQIPVVFSVWDDGYGISVPVRYQTTKESISEALAGFQRTAEKPGLEIIKVKGWDYAGLVEAYQKAAELARTEHVPCLVHVQEVTQPQGHSTSGSHERYKSAERLAWEVEMDCNRQFKSWILENGFATEEELAAIEAEAAKAAKAGRDAAWKSYLESLQPDLNEALEALAKAARSSRSGDEILAIRTQIQQKANPVRSDVIEGVKRAVRMLRFEDSPAKHILTEWLDRTKKDNWKRFNTFLYSQSDESPLQVPTVAPVYADDAPLLDGREIINKNFEALFANDPRIFAIGEDVGRIGDVNQGMAGLQAKFGEIRVTDTGIRETTIIGQGIGTALRGLRPIVEVQYVDYMLYTLATLSDDLACLHYRTAGGQKAPVIVRTRGHRLEGVWHSGSPMAVLLHALRGMHFVVPRNLTQAAGFYNTLLRGDDPALVVEPLNMYRSKEKLPSNLGEFCLPLGKPEILREGTDITIVTYGSMCRIVLEAAEQLAKAGIEAEVIDVQTLIPFDLTHTIAESVKKTNRLIVADEDMPGGASGFMLHKILDEQKVFRYLDASPQTLTAHPHRPAYTTDGDYFSKPNTEDVFDVAYNIMHECDPRRFPALGYEISDWTFSGGRWWNNP
ncbi:MULTISPECIES: thiamine pyrophosphate-dependent enzyme [unclassified Siphonobacter]|uniref:alpha-ketoacid dehydrogenase subunit alpha/beta n=1 Tax=unclassified Siphonobacter TaxID=2635712 RepID=UPI000CC4160C|nr:MULTISPECIES: alpha-ketoacid dehydrogenase subunit alpha/beta [unclassified Siphonobacter]MDQ1088000.1 pyruvate/2-oxoglutarate/acetoin dehydrogenase E1 component/TPP-dependent pyruvate/acetoin dehydrogenase alpha subunit [Siphonobacter sp. SORGH_AS_1065]PKK36952.1 transketolase [Siphonobacter sp. SORGH_AS_0500]